MDRGAWWATVYGVAKSRTQLRDQHTHILIKSKEIALYSHTHLWLKPHLKPRSSLQDSKDEVEECTVTFSFLAME